MPYSFTQIEQDKSKVIFFVFGFLIFIYFAFAWAGTLLMKNYFIFEGRQEYQELSWSWLGFSETFFVSIIAGLFGFGHWKLSTHNLIPRIVGVLKAEKLNPKDQYHQTFQNIIEEVQVATGNKHNIQGVVVPVSAMNAFALSDFEGNHIIGVTEGLLARLNRSQLEAVVGHEAAHIVSGDGLATTVTSSLFDLYSGILRTLGNVNYSRFSRRENRGGLGGFIVIIYLLLVITQFLSHLMNMFISRQREYRADAIAVRLTRNPLALAEALYKLSYRWKGSGLPSEELQAIFIVNPHFSQLEERSGLFPDLFSTHPPIRDRMKILLDIAHADFQVVSDSVDKETKIKQSIPQASNSLYEITRLVKAEKQPLGLFCPRCHIPLQSVAYEGLTVEKCPQCQGTLVSETDVQRLIIREHSHFSDEIVELAQRINKDEYKLMIKKIERAQDTLFQCPHCQKEWAKMWRMFYTEVYRIEIDKCLTCGVIWFDKDELEVLQYLIEEKK